MIYLSFNRFLYKRWKWAYFKLRSARIWFYELQEDYPRRQLAKDEVTQFAREEMYKR